VPKTEVVEAAQADRLWAARRGLFFKPVAGFGSRAAYRGDKLTKRVWQDILAGDYVAQAIVAPGERRIGMPMGIDPQTGPISDPSPSPEAHAGGAPSQAMKFDLRAYAYAGELQWVAARLYQGQTTNFRTPGGGFAPVYSAADGLGLAPHDPKPSITPNPIPQETFMDIKVLGTGCANCKATIALIDQIARATGVSVTLEKVEELRDIMGYGVMSTPGVVIDGKVVHAGGIPSRDKVEKWLAA